MKFDIVISVMNKYSVNDVIKHLLKFEYLIRKIIIVDFDSKNPSFNLIQNPSNSIIQLVYLKKSKHFNKSIGQNIGFYFSKTKYVTFCDGDVKLNVEYFNKIRDFEKSSSNRKFYNPEFVKETENSLIRNAPGICTCSREDFIAINGYSNEYSGWGMEDNDFINRLKKNGAEQIFVSFGVHLTHNNLERVRNYENKNISLTRKNNKLLYKIRNDKNIMNGTYKNDLNKILNERY